MKKIITTLGIIICLGVMQNAFGQTSTYTTSGSEVIFSWGDLEFTDEFKANYPQASIVKQPVRFTLFFHFQQFFHLDLNNNIGFFTGIGKRNVGMISDEILPENYQGGAGVNYFSAKVIRRTYSLGVPLALKLGSFKNHMHLYGGGEMEWSFHMKEKWWDSHSRSGTKTKRTEWWPEDITTFLPSVFVGLQFPGGVNVKFKYYLDNFLNQNNTRYTDATNPAHVVSDLTKYKQSNLYYIALTYQIRTIKIIQLVDSDY